MCEVEFYKNVSDGSAFAGNEWFSADFYDRLIHPHGYVYDVMDMAQSSFLSQCLVTKNN